MKQDDTLSLRQRRAIAALLDAPTTTAAALQAGCARVTLHRWLRQPAFRAALTLATDARLAEVYRGVLALGTEAIDTLRGVMAGRAAAGVKTRAALGVLAQLTRLAELIDLAARVGQLEEQEVDGDSENASANFGTAPTTGGGAV